MYYSADLLDTPQDVAGVIEHYLDISAVPRGDNRYYVFLDEISSVPDWQRSIKWMVDMNMLKNSTIMVTGSHSVYIRRSAERLPGRRGKVRDNHDKILLPMRFSEYTSVIYAGLKNIMEKNNLFSMGQRRSVFMGLLDKKIDDVLYELLPHLDELDRILHNYMITGGIPMVVNEKIRTGNISESTNATYSDDHKFLHRACAGCYA